MVSRYQDRGAHRRPVPSDPVGVSISSDATSGPPATGEPPGRIQNAAAALAAVSLSRLMELVDPRSIPLIIGISPRLRQKQPSTPTRTGEAVEQRSRTIKSFQHVRLFVMCEVVQERQELGVRKFTADTLM